MHNNAVGKQTQRTVKNVRRLPLPSSTSFVTYAAKNDAQATATGFSQAKSLSVSCHIQGDSLHRNTKAARTNIVLLRCMLTRCLKILSRGWSYRISKSIPH
jgi:hypothetical protein